MAEIGILDLIRSAEKISFLAIALIILGAWVSIAVIGRVVPWVAGKLPSRFRLWLLPAVPLARLLITTVAGVRIFTLVFEPDWKDLLTVGAAVVLALGFAFKDFISSIVAGMVNLFERPCRPGDWVRVAGAYGEVSSLGWRSFKLVTPDDTVVTIPNSMLWTSSIHNANDGATTLMCVADVYVRPSHDGVRALGRLRDVALTSPFVRLDKPVLVVAQEKPWATHYRVKAYPTDGRDQFQFITDLTVRAKKALLEEGMELATVAAAV